MLTHVQIHFGFNWLSNLHQGMDHHTCQIIMGLALIGGEKKQCPSLFIPVANSTFG